MTRKIFLFVLFSSSSMSSLCVNCVTYEIADLVALSGTVQLIASFNTMDVCYEKLCCNYMQFIVEYLCGMLVRIVGDNVW